MIVVARILRAIRAFFSAMVEEMGRSREFVRENAAKGREAYEQAKAEILAKQRNRSNTDA